MKRRAQTRSGQERKFASAAGRESRSVKEQARSRTNNSISFGNQTCLCFNSARANLRIVHTSCLYFTSPAVPCSRNPTFNRNQKFDPHPVVWLIDKEQANLRKFLKQIGFRCISTVLFCCAVFGTIFLQHFRKSLRR